MGYISPELTAERQKDQARTQQVVEEPLTEPSGYTPGAVVTWWPWKVPERDKPTSWLMPLLPSMPWNRWFSVLCSSRLDRTQMGSGLGSSHLHTVGQAHRLQGSATVWGLTSLTGLSTVLSLKSLD